MAGRTSTSFGVAATITILGILSLALFVVSAVFFGKYNDAKRNVDSLTSSQAEIIAEGERNSDDVRLLKDEARKSGGRSLVGYLLKSQQDTMQAVTGNRRDTFAAFQNRLKNVEGSETGSLLSILSARDAEVARLRDEYARADAARTTAQADQKNAVDRIRSIEENHQRTVDALSAEVGQYRDEVETYRSGADDYKKQIDAQASRMATEFAETKKSLETQLAKLTDEKLILENQLAILRGQKNLETFRGRPEESLVDGEVIGLNSADGTVALSIGARNKVALGMTFAVYADANSIKPDANGRYAPGKATLEVISVEPTSSTARITSEVKGNPVVRGDVIANALYDPAKVYKFVVFGNFDTDRDRIATALERQDAETMITAWGGLIVPDLSGDVDFLVLGERPVLPPRPGADAPLEVVQEFIRRQREVERYDNLFKNATSTGIPVLNENRLYTLIGKTPARLR